MELLRIGELKEKQTRIYGDGEVVNPTYVFSDTIDTSLYNDITSNVSWDNIGNSNHDYNFYRNQISLYTASVGWDGLSQEDKIIAAKYFVVDKTKRDEVISEDQQISAWSTLVTFSQISRYQRWEGAKKYISYKLSPINSSELGDSTSELCNKYINYNIITKSRDGISGLFDYLTGEGDYIGLGYPEKSYWTQQDQDKIMDILENGNY